MKKNLVVALAFVAGAACLTRPDPAAASDRAGTVRAEIRADALARFAAGDVQEVAERRVQRKRYRSGSPYALRSIHRKGRWCGKGRWYGKRCYYTPSGLKPFRQG